MSKKLNIKSTINTQEWANQILKINSWKDAVFDKKAMPKNFQDYVKDLDLLRTKDTANFCRIMNNLLKYKLRGKIIREILKGDVILLRKKNETK